MDEHATALNDPSMESESLAAELTDVSTDYIEVRMGGGEIHRYSDLQEVEEAVLRGKIPRTAEARLVTDEGREKAEWCSFEEFAASTDPLRRLYQPVWSAIMSAAGIGAVVGIGLKLLDTSATLFMVDDRVGVAFLFVVAALVAAQWLWWAPLAAAFFLVKAGIGAGLFMAAFASCVVGSLFGVPAGMLIGGAVGWHRSRSKPLAPDAQPEAPSTYWLGIAVPAGFLATALPVYFLWLMPWMIAYLEK